VLCNHDVTRTVTRYGRADTGFDFAAKRFGTPAAPELGTRRARAAALLTLALPGSVYVYQGEELGLPEADIPLDRIQDPMHFRSRGTDPGQRRLPGAPAVGGGGAVVRLRRRGRAVAAAARHLGVVRGRPAERRPGVDAHALPSGPAAAPVRGRLRGRSVDLAPRPAG